jgi:hypothetical protein
MRTKKVKIYKLHELSDEARQKAIDDFRYEEQYPWNDYNKGVIDAFIEMISIIKVDKAYYGDRDHGVEWEFYYGTEHIGDLSGIRLLKYLWNNFSSTLYSGKYYSKGKISRHSKVILEENILTGYYIGANILKPIFDFMNKPNESIDFSDLINDCFHEWVKACEANLDYYFSDENIANTIELNEIKFTKDGRVFRY